MVGAALLRVDLGLLARSHALSDFFTHELGAPRKHYLVAGCAGESHSFLISSNTPA